MNFNQLTNFKKTLSLVTKQNKKIKIYFLLALLLTILSSGLITLLPFIFSHLLNKLSLQSQNKSSLTLILLSIYGATWTLSQFFSQLKLLIIGYISENIVSKFSITLFQHLHNLSLRFHLDRKTGAILNSIQRAHAGFETVTLDLLMFLLPVFFELVIIFSVLVYRYGMLLGVGLIFIITLFICLNLKVIKTISKAQNDYNEKRSKASAAVLDSLLNAETVKYFSNQKFENERCQKLLDNQMNSGIKKHYLDAYWNSIQILTVGFLFTLTTFITGNAVLNGVSTIAEFVLINGCFLQFMLPLQHIVFAVQQMRKGLLDLNEAYELLEIHPEIQDCKNSTDLNTDKVELEFDNVSFSYNERPILKNVSFKISSGKTVAIVGPSGSGKSTLARLIFRFFDVTAGSIKINNINIKDLTQSSLHKALAIVPQDIVLFNDSLNFNIAYGKTDATQYEINEAAKQAQLENLINCLPEGYETPVGERGLKFSGGEKQRIAIARMLLKKPLVYIFDEATSSLDTNTEYEIQKQIREISFGSTTLIIAHRLSTIMHADEIIVLDNGTIIEHGEHQELVSLNGIYRKLWNEQIGS